MRTMYDAVTPRNIPADAEMVAGYIDGNYAWGWADWQRFPRAVKVRIAVFASTLDGDVLDCENGDATPEQCPGWVQARRNAGHPAPTIYCSESEWPIVDHQFAVQGVASPQWWIAGYPGSVGAGNLYPGAVAHQYEDHQDLYDISAVADHWPGVDPSEEDDMADPQVLAELQKLNAQLGIANKLAATQFLRSAYGDVLHRPPDAPGEEHWLWQIAAGEDPLAVWHDFETSPEATGAAKPPAQ